MSNSKQNGTTEEERSVARAYAERKGWTVPEAYVFVDDGVSGAEFHTRHGFLRLMNALKPRAPFQALVMSEESRLGREQIEVSYALKQLILAGVRVFSYLTDTERTLNSPIEKATLALQTMADEMEREKARQRTHDAMARQARAGHVTGGGCFGYDNFPVIVSGSDGVPRRSHVERRINEREAAVVRQVFSLCAAGHGIRAIAKQLNAEGAPCPRPLHGRPQAWAPSSVRAVLYRCRYRGEIEWNRTSKRDEWGLRRTQPRPREQWVCTQVPALRIVPDELWAAAHARLAQARESYLRGTDARLWGRPTGVESRYLLPGLARCAECGGALVVLSHDHGQRRQRFYGCSSYHQRGPSVCANRLKVRIEQVDQAVLAAFEDQILAPSSLEDVMREAVARLRPAVEGVETEVEHLLDALAKVETEIEHLTAAVAAGGELASLVAGLKDCERQCEELRRQLAGAERAATAGRASQGLEEAVRAKLADWNGLLQRQVPQARQILKKLLQGALVFAPKTDGDESHCEFQGDVSLEGILAGVTKPSWVARPGGLEDLWTYPLEVLAMAA